MTNLSNSHVQTPAAPLLLLGVITSIQVLLITPKAVAQAFDSAQLFLMSAVHKEEIGDYQGAIEDYSKSIELSPNGLYGQHYIRRGDLKYQLGDGYGAVSDYATGISLGNTFGVSYKRLGRAKALIGDLSGAISEYTTAIQILSPPNQRTPDLVNEVLILRGNARMALKDNQGACIDFKTAASFGSQEAIVYLRGNDGAWCASMP